MGESLRCLHGDKSFNPRAREGRDAAAPTANWIPDLFQSTRPRGARQVILSAAASINRFNPRAREGRDVLR